MPKADQIYHKRDLEKVFYYAQAVKAGNTFYVSGCVSRDAAGNVIGEGNMKAQIKGGKPGAVRFVVRRVGAHVVLEKGYKLMSLAELVNGVSPRKQALT